MPASAFNLQLALVVFPLNVMSSFQSIFDAALAEYARKTGSDINTDPLTVRLWSCTSPIEIHAVLQEQAQKFDDFRNGGRKEQIMKKLKPIVDVLLTLCDGGVLGNSIGLVSVRLRTHFCRRFLTHNLQKFPPASAIVAGIGLLLAVRVSFPSTRSTVVTRTRPLRALAQVMTHS